MGVKIAAIPVSRAAWKPSYRIIPSRFPTINVFERVADPQDLEAVFMVESLTNDRMRDQNGEIILVRPEDRASGAGASYIMSAFTRLNPTGGRFSDGAYGVYYCAHDEGTAIAETAYHRALFMAATSERPCELDMLVLLANLAAGLHDLRKAPKSLRPVLDPDSYAAGQTLGGKLRQANSHGIVYPSVRAGGGECAAVFQPKALSQCRHGKHLCYVWDGHAIARAYEKREIR